MTLERLYQPKYLVCVLFVVALLLTACSPAAPPAAPTTVAAVAVTGPTQTPTLIVEEPPTAAPTQSPEVIQETATAEAVRPTALPTSAAALEVGSALAKPEVSAYCLPLTSSVANILDPLSPPSYARKATKTTNSLELSGLPANGCIFIYQFPGTAPDGLKLEVTEPNQTKAFYSVELKPVQGKPDTVWALVRHGMIVSPAKAYLRVQFVIRDPLGQAIRTDLVNLSSWVEDTPAPQESKKEDCGCSPVIP